MMTKHAYPGVFSYCRLFMLLFMLFSTAGTAYATAAAEKTEKISLQRGTEQIAVFTVEAVSHKQKLQKGLSGRQSIPDSFGMLFILDSTREQFFWMKGMEFSLDILFFDSDRKLIEVLPDLLPCDTCRAYKAPPNTAYALEINAGMANVLGVKKGDTFVFTDE